MTLKAVDIVCALRECKILSSQDAPITNDLGAALTEGNVYLVLPGFMVSPHGEAPADGDTFAAVVEVPMAKLKKLTGITVVRGQVLYYDPANGQFDDKPRLYFPTAAPWDMTTADTIVMSIDGGSDDTVTIETGDVVSIDAVTAAELIALIATDISGAVGKSVTGLDGETYLYLEHSAGGAGASIKITGGTGTGLSSTGLVSGMIAVPQAKAWSAGASAATYVFGEFDGAAGGKWLNMALAAGSGPTSAGVVQIPLQKFLKEDLLTPLPSAGNATNLGLVAGTHGSASPSLQGSDLGGSSGSETARMLLQVPQDYDSGDLTLRFHAGVLTTVYDTTLTLDVEAYEADGEAGIGSDLCETAATSINALTLADKDFTIDGDGLVAGDVLDVQITVAAEDSGDLGVMKAIIGACKLLYTRAR